MTVHTFTSAVIQSSVLLRAPYCMLNEDIRADFAQALQVFSDIEPYSALAGRALPILRKLKEALERGPIVGGESQMQQPAQVQQSTQPAQVVHQANSTDSLSVLPAPPTYPPLPVDPSLNPSTAAFAPPPQQHYDVHNDPAGVLLSNLNTPIAWDSRALDFSSYDSIGETLCVPFSLFPRSANPADVLTYEQAVLEPGERAGTRDERMEPWRVLSCFL